MQRAVSFCGVILAAGESFRMGRPKALLPWKRGTFLSCAIRALTQHTDLVIVVMGANEDLLRPVVDANAGYAVVNPEPARGQFSSLRIGVQEVLNRGRDGAIITLVDRPPANSATISHLKNEFLDTPASDVWAVVPELNGKHGHPIVIGREMIERFLDAPSNATAREVQHENQERIRYVRVTDSFVAFNIDTPEDYERLVATTVENASS
jgi:molybdenum cofactor cytidylyltransferase